jgi:hypothetical protein
MAMKRALAVKAAGDWQEAAAVDRVVLDADGRFRRRLLLTESGRFLLDLARPTPPTKATGCARRRSIVRVDGKPSGWSKSARPTLKSLRVSPGTLAIATPTFRSSTTGCASGAIMFSKRCCGDLERRSPKSRRRSIPSPALTDSTAMSERP